MGVNFPTASIVEKKRIVLGKEEIGAPVQSH